MGVFSKVFKSRDSSRVRSRTTDSTVKAAQTPAPKWEDAWSRKSVAPEEIHELLHVCTQEVKSRALEVPFLLLPFRPTSDQSTAAKYFIRNYFRGPNGRNPQYDGQGLHQELRLIEPLVLCSIMKWCWSRLSGGVVTWNTYELFRVGELDSNMAKHAFDTFIPLSVESEAHKKIIFDFFDLLAAIAANGKSNGLGGRKLSRLAGWWAFDHPDTGKGFNGGYKSWASAADATSHLFFAYLRFLAPDGKPGTAGVSKLPRSLQALLSQTEYPPQTPELLLCRTSKVAMIVNSVSPTPYALLRRAKNFEYRDGDPVLQHFSEYSDPLGALTPECRRVLDAISSTNSTASKIPEGNVASTPADASWSRFEDIGFSSLLDEPNSNTDAASGPYSRLSGSDGLRPSGGSAYTNVERPSTPSWADFLSSGFTDDASTRGPPSLLLPPDQILPPLSPGRVQSSQSHIRSGLRGDNLEPGELASINQMDLDETFWWVWITSLAPEETADRKGVFGRCAFVETEIIGGRWLIIEEQIKGSAVVADEGLFVIEKRNKFSSFTRRGRTRRESTGKRPPVPNAPYQQKNSAVPQSRATIGPDRHAKVQAAAAALVQKKKDEEDQAAFSGRRRARTDEYADSKTNSVMTLGLQPVIMKEAGPAMQWARKFDKETIRQQYLGDNMAGKGEPREASPHSSTLNLPTSLSAGDATALAQQERTGEREISSTSEPTEQPIAPPSVLPPAPLVETAPIVAKNDVLPSPPQAPINDFVPRETSAPIRTYAPVESSAPLEMSAPLETSVPSMREPNSVSVDSGTVTESDRAPPNVSSVLVADESTPGNTSPTYRFGRKPVGSVDSTTRSNPTYHKPPNSQVSGPPVPSKTGTEQSAAAKAAAIAANGARTSKPTSPESEKKKAPIAPKSQKGSTRGLKGMFNKKKPAAPESLAAVRAMNGPKLAAEQPKLSRTPSFLRRKAAAESEATSQSSAPQRETPAPPETVGMPMYTPEPNDLELNDMDDGEPGPVVTTTDPHDFSDSAGPPAPAMIHPDANDSSARFSNFSQGPVEDMPSAMPTEEPDDSVTPKPQSRPTSSSARQFNTLAAARLAPDPTPVGNTRTQTTDYATSAAGYETAMEPRTSTADDASTAMADDEESPRQSFAPAPKTVRAAPVTAPPQHETEAADRWAQIRKNAAERKIGEGQRATRARNQSQTQSVETEKTDDGETSGEETIESRVARIKARVAELTGSSQQATQPAAP